MKESENLRWKLKLCLQQLLQKVRHSTEDFFFPSTFMQLLCRKLASKNRVLNINKTRLWVRPAQREQ